MAIELILLAVNINLVAFSAFLGDLTGPIVAMFVPTVAAVKGAIGLAILVIYSRERGTMAVASVAHLKGWSVPTILTIVCGPLLAAMGAGLGNRALSNTLAK